MKNETGQEFLDDKKKNQTYGTILKWGPMPAHSAKSMPGSTFVSIREPTGLVQRTVLA